MCERGKERYVRSISFYDRVVQRALCDQLTPIVTPYLTYDNGASIKNKGIDFARKRVETHLHKYYRKYGNRGYALIIDFSKFYDNILHRPLMDMYKEIIDDEDILKLIAHLIDSFSIDVSNYDAKAGEKDEDPDAEYPTTGKNAGINLVDMRGVDYDDEKWDTFMDQLTIKDIFISH